MVNKILFWLVFAIYLLQTTFLEINKYSSIPIWLFNGTHFEYLLYYDKN